MCRGGDATGEERGGNRVWGGIPTGVTTAATAQIVSRQSGVDKSGVTVMGTTLLFHGKLFQF